jgi:putative ABC transport system substrate-binding protein
MGRKGYTSDLAILRGMRWFPLLLAAWLAAPLPALAQGAGKVHRIGVLLPASANDPELRANFGVFTGRLRELGYAEGSTLAIEWRHAEGRYDRLQSLAGELVKAKVDVIVTSGTPATSAARRMTATIPIVATSFGDPVMSGFAQSLARPGGNVTGFSTMGSLVYEKRLELLLEAVPGTKRVGVLVNPENDFHLHVLPGLRAAAEKRGVDIVLVNAGNARDIQEGMSSMASRRVGGILVGDDAFIRAQGGTIAALALKYKLPTIFPSPRGVEDGGLIAYTSDLRQRFRSAADYVDRILRGAKPGELPIEQPAKLELAVNGKTAKALGIALPPALLQRASRVVE